MPAFMIAGERTGQNLFGYDVQKISDAPGEVNYLLVGPRVTYRLVRRMRGKTLYALNSHGNICGIKGNYNFIERDGKLAPYYDL